MMKIMGASTEYEHGPFSLTEQRTTRTPPCHESLAVPEEEVALSLLQYDYHYYSFHTINVIARFFRHGYYIIIISLVSIPGVVII